MPSNLIKVKNTNRSRTSKPRLRRVALVFAALLLLSVGGGIGTASLTDLEGTFHVQIRPSIEGFLVCGPVGGPFMPGPCIALEPYTAHFLIGDAVDPNGGDLSFEWDLSFDSYDFIPEVTGIGPVSVTLEDGPALQFIAVRVTSTSGAQGLIWTYFEVQNVPPVADPGGPYTVDSDTPITFSGSATDPSTADTTAVSSTSGTSTTTASSSTKTTVDSLSMIRPTPTPCPVFTPSVWRQETSTAI